MTGVPLDSFDVIISHGPGCKDGAVAAWIIWRRLAYQYRNSLKKWGGFYDVPSDDPSVYTKTHPNSQEGAILMQEQGCSPVFVFCKPQTGISAHLISNKRVLILDLDLGDALLGIVEAASYVFLCDHHASTLTTVSRNSDFFLVRNVHKFSMFVNPSPSESAASLVWQLSYGHEIPPFIDIVRIADTWQWNERPELYPKAVIRSLELSRAFRSFVDIERTYETWGSCFSTYIYMGKGALSVREGLVNKAAKNHDIGVITLKDGTTYTVAYAQATILHSDIGVAIRKYAQKRCETIHVCATWKYIARKGIIIVSLRDGLPDLDLAHIAQNVVGSTGKGGGHKDAASFVIPGLDKFHQIIQSPPSL